MHRHAALIRTLVCEERQPHALRERSTPSPPSGPGARGRGRGDRRRTSRFPCSRAGAARSRRRRHLGQGRECESGGMWSANRQRLLRRAADDPGHWEEVRRPRYAQRPDLASRVPADSRRREDPRRPGPRRLAGLRGGRRALGPPDAGLRPASTPATAESRRTRPRTHPDHAGSAADAGTSTASPPTPSVPTTASRHPVRTAAVGTPTFLRHGDAPAPPVTTPLGHGDGPRVAHGDAPAGRPRDAPGRLADRPGDPAGPRHRPREGDGRHRAPVTPRRALARRRATRTGQRRTHRERHRLPHRWQHRRYGCEADADPDTVHRRAGRHSAGIADRP